jgi:hypothetical protein
MIDFKPLNAVIPQQMWDALGYIPDFLDINNPKTAIEQFDIAYKHGGGWSNFQGFTLLDNMRIRYPGDNPLKPFAMATFRDQEIYVYPGPWVMVKSSDGSFQISRMD